MSSTLPTPPPFQQWQQFFPNGTAYGYDQTELNQILSGVSGTYAASKQQFANDIARDTLRAIDRNGQDNMSTTERTASQLASSIERNGSQGMSTTERVNAQVTAAVERNGALNYGAIERVAGENRMTTVVTDAASRQATNDSIRDVLRAVDANGSAAVNTTKDAHNGLLGAIERNAGEGRMTTVVTGGQNDAKMTDVRHAIINETNRGTNELLGTIRQTNESLSMSVNNGAWETRSAMNAGFSQAMLEQLKANAETNSNMFKAHSIEVLEAQKLAARADDHYSSLLLEQQKVKEYLSSKGDNHFAINQLEMQKVKEGLAAQAGHHYSSTQLEIQKVKEGLASQAAQQFAISQLEAQKVREQLSAQLAEAKYESLKSQQFLSDKMRECCCEVKMKIDDVDRDRLRDNLIVQKEKTNTLELLELT